MNIKLKPVLVLVTDRYGDVIYPAPVKMMRDHLGLSQRQMTQQATPRDVAETQKTGLLRRMIDAGLRLARSRL